MKKYRYENVDTDNLQFQEKAKNLSMQYADDLIRKRRHMKRRKNLSHENKKKVTSIKRDRVSNVCTFSKILKERKRRM